MNEKKKAEKMKKPSSVRPTRAVQRDRSKRLVVNPPPEQVGQRLHRLIHPATLAQVAHFQQQGLRERTLTLPVMMALLVSLVWRQISGMTELARLMQTEALLWATPIKVSQQALSQRLSSLPATLFGQLLANILPLCQQRWAERERPLAPEVAWAQERYTAVLRVDGSTLDALIRKLGLLKDLEQNPLAGKLTALLDGGSRLPRAVWHEPNSPVSDQDFWPPIQASVQQGMLLIFDRGYTHFAMFAQLTKQAVTFITRAKPNLAFTVDEVLHCRAAVHDRLVGIGQGETRQRLRLIEMLHQGCGYRVVKRLLGLAYFWRGSQNAVTLQLWTTWLLYAVLVDLTDAVSDALNRPFAAISIEMVYRSLYYFTQAHRRGQADDLVT
jgi:hypothetical protein